MLDSTRFPRSPPVNSFIERCRTLQLAQNTLKTYLLSAFIEVLKFETETGKAKERKRHNGIV